ncbi:MAG: UDP-2,3-diacylglucosamine diphosphatase LpxI [Pseudolabrys sp.]|nr:UDP-2,3-diacylglucosamine diphosphatase LpxI [Pseudolabrys sp.]
MTGQVSDPAAPLAIIAGGGEIPFTLADTLTVKQRPFVIFAIRGVADSRRVAGYRHHWLGLGQLGRFIRLARAEGCREIVLIGALRRPSLWRIQMDFGALWRLPRIIAALRGGDDHLLRNIGRLFEDEGFLMRGVHEFVPQAVMPEGILTTKWPSERDRADIERGLRVLHENGPRDLGQAVIVANGEILGLEGDDGTDHLLKQVAAQRQGAGSGVLVKAPKPLQDRRYDLPAIGPTTIAGVAKAALSGIAVVAGGGIVADLDGTIEAANRAGIFLVGVREGP